MDLKCVSVCVCVFKKNFLSFFFLLFVFFSNLTASLIFFNQNPKNFFVFYSFLKVCNTNLYTLPHMHTYIVIKQGVKKTKNKKKKLKKKREIQTKLNILTNNLHATHDVHKQNHVCARVCFPVLISVYRCMEVCWWK